MEADLAARRGDVLFLASQPPGKLLLLDGNGDSVITHAVDSRNRRSLKFLLSLPSCADTLQNVLSKDENYPLMQPVTNDDLECAARLLHSGARIMVPVNHFEDRTVAPVDSRNRRSLKFLLSLPSCADTLQNVLSKDENYPLMQPVTNDDLECAARLLHAGARIMVPVNHFEDRTVAPTSMLHEIIFSMAYLEDGSGNAEDRLMLATLLEDLLENPESKYSWAEQVGILLFKTIIGEGVTGTQMRTPLELAQFLGLHEAAQQLARVQNTLCTSLFHEPNPDRINFPLDFLRREVPLNAFSLTSDAKVRYYADSLKSLYDLSPSAPPLNPLGAPLVIWMCCEKQNRIMRPDMAVGSPPIITIIIIIFS